MGRLKPNFIFTQHLTLFHMDRRGADSTRPQIVFPVITSVRYATEPQNLATIPKI